MKTVKIYFSKIDILKSVMFLKFNKKKKILLNTAKGVP